MSRPGKRASQAADAPQFTQFSTWLQEDVAKALAARAAAEGKSKRAVATAALSAYLASKSKLAPDEDDEP